MAPSVSGPSAQELTDLVRNALGTVALSSAVFWVGRKWLSARLEGSIDLVYSQKLATHESKLETKLESHKNALAVELQSMRHEYEIRQLRTSLFFKHQQSAFSQILSKIAETNQHWFKDSYEPSEQTMGAVPSGLRTELTNLYFKHQLFLDHECRVAMELLFELYRNSLPFDDGNGGEPEERDGYECWVAAGYLLPRLATVFQSKIGLSRDSAALREIVLLGSIRIINRSHFPEAGIPAAGDLRLRDGEGAGESVIRAQRNEPAVIAKMQEFYDYLRLRERAFLEMQTRLKTYLDLLATYPAGS